MITYVDIFRLSLRQIFNIASYPVSSKCFSGLHLEQTVLLPRPGLAFYTALPKGVDEPVGYVVMPMETVVKGMPPASEGFHVWRAAVIYMRPRAICRNNEGNEHADVTNADKVRYKL